MTNHDDAKDEMIRRAEGACASGDNILTPPRIDGEKQKRLVTVRKIGRSCASGMI